MNIDAIPIFSNAGPKHPLTRLQRGSIPKQSGKWQCLGANRFCGFHILLRSHDKNLTAHLFIIIHWASILYPPIVTHMRVWIMWISVKNTLVFAK